MIYTSIVVAIPINNIKFVRLPSSKYRRSKYNTNTIAPINPLLVFARTIDIVKKSAKNTLQKNIKIAPDVKGFTQ